MSLGALALAVVSVLAIADSAAAVEDQPGSARTDAAPTIDWRGDLDLLVEVLPRVHVDSTHATSRDAFLAAARELRERIATLPAAAARVELAGLVARIGDGHTRVNLLRPGAPGVPSRPEEGFAPLPIELYGFADGLYVRSATAEHRDLIGTRVVTIGALPVAEAVERVGRFMHRDNAMTVRLGVPWLLTRPAFLLAAGAVDDTEGAVALGVETTSGESLRRLLRPAMASDATTVDVLDGVAERPVWLQGRERPYRIESLDAGATLYVQFNAVRDDEKESLAAFAARVERRLGSREVVRVVVDLRHNDGGNFVLALPLVDVLDRFDAARGPGALFVAIGRATFSAAGVFAALVEARTEAVFVGEPTGARPNTWGDLDTFELPSSGLVVGYSSRYFQPAGPYDERPWIDPDVTAELDFAAYASGHDPVLEAIRAYRPEPPLGERLVAAAVAGSVDDALRLHREERARPDRRLAWTADELETLGVHYWRERDWTSAAAVWRELARWYPDSPEGLENLAETLQAAGDREAAVAALMESLAVEPGNPDAVELVDELCGEAALRMFLSLDLSDAEGRERLRSACGVEPARPQVRGGDGAPSQRDRQASRASSTASDATRRRGSDPSAPMSQRPSPPARSE